jgi:hypothetical protein
MSKAVLLECSHDAFDELHAAVDHTRKGSATVKVDKDALAALLRDHGKLIRLHSPEIGGVR